MRLVPKYIISTKEGLPYDTCSYSNAMKKDVISVEGVTPEGEPTLDLQLSVAQAAQLIADISWHMSRICQFRHTTPEVIDETTTT